MVLLSARSLPPSAIQSANKEVRCVTASGSSVQPACQYNTYTPSQKATIGIFTVENRVVAAKRKFSAKLNIKLNESTVRRFKNAYLQERQQKHDDESDTKVKKLHPKNEGGR